MVLIGDAHRAGDSVVLTRRSSGERGRDEPDGTEAVPMGLSKFHAPEIVFGNDSLPKAAHAALRLGARRPFVVTDPGLTEAGWPSELLAQLRAAGLAPQVWTDVTPNPKDHEIEAGHQRYRESGCDVVLGIGGGSVIDAAKGVALLAANGGRILDYEGIDRIEHPIPPLIMMPSTSGTGADVSQFCIVTDTERHTKHDHGAGAGPRRVGHRPAAAGHHAGVAERGDRAGRAHPRHRGVRVAGPRPAHRPPRVAGRVPGQRKPGPDHAPAGDRTARMFMAQAALEAGLAFTNAILGATHAMSHQVGGMLDLPHGVVNGVLLPHVIRFNGAEFPERFVPIAQAMGLDVTGAPAGEAVEMLAEEIRRLGDEVGVPRGLGALGVVDDDIPKLAELTLGDACLTTNPRLTSVNDVETMFKAAM